MTTDEKIKWLLAASFTIETLAHLRGFELELLPQAEAPREIARSFPAEG